MDVSIAKHNPIKHILKNLSRTKILNRLDRGKNGDSHPHAASEGYLKSIDYFRQRYFIEQRRAERKGYEFALMILDLSSDGRGLNFNPLLLKLEQMLLQTARSVLRMTDVAVNYYYGKMAILLPDTTAEGAYLALKRIKAMLNEMAAANEAEIFQRMKIDVYCYPIQADEIHQFVYDRLVDDNQPTVQFEKTIQQMKTYFCQRNGNNRQVRLPLMSSLRWSPSMALVIENPFCWLSEIFEDMQESGSRAAKRALDLLIALALIILLSPLMALIAIAIKLTSPGPIIFRQERLGLMGKKFMMYKFRTMYRSRDETPHQQFVQDFIRNSERNYRLGMAENQIYKMQHDPRITAIGRLLRRTSLDEIPQLFNVLRGEMSLVGPRPPLQYEVELYDLWHRRRYLTVKPGITGLWQIYGRSRTTFDEMVRLDLAYSTNWSLRLDLKILLKTLLVPFNNDGAY